MPRLYIFIIALRTASLSFDLKGTASHFLLWSSTTTKAYLKPLSLGKNNKSACCA